LQGEWLLWVKFVGVRNIDVFFFSFSFIALELTNEFRELLLLIESKFVTGVV
jgi:hypothetical protein